MKIFRISKEERLQRKESGDPVWWFYRFCQRKGIGHEVGVGFLFYFGGISVVTHRIYKY